MAFLGGNSLPPDINPKLILAGIATVVFFAIGLTQRSPSKKSQDGDDDENPGFAKSALLFCYSCFLKPHSDSAKGNQQDALESFYSSQAGVYDVTRKTLLKGREDMLALVAAQLQFKAEKDGKKPQRKRVWVDVGFSNREIESVLETLTCPN
jgi:betaine lipid synthase